MAKNKAALNADTLQDQLDKERRLVSFDSYDLSVRQILDMFEVGEINVPPEYQRQFIWDEVRESELVESVLLGIPVPSLFMATNKDATWEIVDGVQRLGTLAHFLGTGTLVDKVNKKEPLKIAGLEKLSAMNNERYSDLPKSVQLMFATRPIRVTVLNDKSDMAVRFDLFERLNTGGIALTNQEIRNCVYRGPFNEDLKRLTNYASFQASIKLKAGDARNGTAEEFALRYFAFLEGYRTFDHSVKGFLNDYMELSVKKKISPALEKTFKKTFDFISGELPTGIVRGNRGVTPVNLYEAISVGCGQVFKSNKKPKAGELKKLLDNVKLREFTMAGTNSRKAVTNRIEIVRDALE